MLVLGLGLVTGGLFGLPRLAGTSAPPVVFLILLAGTLRGYWAALPLLGRQLSIERERLLQL